jgi:phosphoribosyl 1,2-cyclic phosphate phosphodiesterase
MRLTLLGTGDARQVPVYGCECRACLAALEDPRWRRLPCCALVEAEGQRWLIDSGLTDLTERFPPRSLSGILQTHYHADHAQGLLHLRWGQGLVIPVDPEGLADLYKHPGILDFSRPFSAFEERVFGALKVTALPLLHSKPTLGYLLEDIGLGDSALDDSVLEGSVLEDNVLENSVLEGSGFDSGGFGGSGAEGDRFEGAGLNGAGGRIAYLTDTVGLPDDTMAHLQRAPLDVLILDCSMPPQPQTPRNHNDLNLALQIIDALQPRKAVLTHVGHTFDAWLTHEPRALPENVVIARDGMVV